MLMPTGADAGALLLAEYVAVRSKIKLLSSTSMGKTNSVWQTSASGSAPGQPLSFADAVRMTFCHRVTKEKVKGLVPEDPLVQETKRFVRAVAPKKLPEWVVLGTVCVGLVTRCVPWMRHAAAFFLNSRAVDIFELVSTFNGGEQMSGMALEFTSLRFVPRRCLKSGSCLVPTRDVNKITSSTVLGFFKAFRGASYELPLTRQGVIDLVAQVFPRSWRLNVSHFLRWLALLGFATSAASDEGDDRRGKL
ncbi:unnamed protein product [Prorocentrum cordatum]|uniref:Uncharacterized protein n=1 Tax=Prorocentrum cordatum TaxID=2364126 RepID=A0ABN9UAN7_9DINO|nr:unnamed protein product [Polarella glacialis]